MVKFRSFQTKHAFQCQVHKHDKVSVLKRVARSLQNMPLFSRVQMLISVIIKTNWELFITDAERTSVGTIPITWWYSSVQWHLLKMNCLLPLAPTHISRYQPLHLWQLTETSFLVDLAVQQFKKRNHTVTLAGNFL